jgi:tRNA (guanine26-N2/guanine27-N2)-dimethyltransferase
MKEIKEESAEIFIPETEKISREMDVFYNPKMKLNRDVTILLLNSIENKEMSIADILAGTGIRAIRMLKELELGKIKKILINDYDEKSFLLIKKNLEKNKMNENEGLIVENKEASKLLLESTGFDYIDVDPFGSPNAFLDAAIKRISRNGILAITATDTAALSGSMPNACVRKYFAKNTNNFLMHETGIRILARKIQLVGAQYDKALIPIFSYSKEHYCRIFFRCDKGKKKVDEILKNHKYILFCKECLNFYVSEKNSGICCDKEMNFLGPLWVGELWNNELGRRMKNSIVDSENQELVSLISIISDESKINTVGFFDLHELSEKLKISVPKFEKITNDLEKNGFKVSRTHFSRHSIKTDAELKDVLNTLKI